VKNWTKIVTAALGCAVLACGAATNVVAASSNVWPAALVPAWRDFAAKCTARTATRGDLIGLKRLVSAAPISEDLKVTLVGEARILYQKCRPRDRAKETK